LISAILRVVRVRFKPRAESKSLYITKDAADDLVQILGRYLLALE
jgi:hypothetical protein